MVSSLLLAPLRSQTSSTPQQVRDTLSALSSAPAKMLSSKHWSHAQKLRRAGSWPDLRYPGNKTSNLAWQALHGQMVFKCAHFEEPICHPGRSELPGSHAKYSGHFSDAGSFATVLRLDVQCLGPGPLIQIRMASPLLPQNPCSFDASTSVGWK